MTKILAIETSCDETAIALVKARGGLRKPRFEIIKNLVASQVKIHRSFGGVVPNLAKREHLRNLPILLSELVGINSLKLKVKSQNSKSQIKIQNFLKTIDLIAVTVGPGLEPALWTGIEFAKKLKADSYKLKAKLVGVNHLEGHLYSFLLEQKRVNPKRKNLEFRASDLNFPVIALLVSGGHTILLLMKSLTRWKKLGETRDDAAGEAFDKVARLLKLPYPGGPEIEKLANYGSPTSLDFPRPMLNQKNYDFSFSGLKTAVLYCLRDHPEIIKADVAASFQQAAVETLVVKTIRAAKEFKARSVILGGGVAANKKLRRELKMAASRNKINFIAPTPQFNTDNAAMIAAAAYVNLIAKKRSLALKARSDLNFKSL